MSRRRMLASLCREGDPRVVALARAMGRPGDSGLVTAACAWIASKFEEVYSLEAIDVLRVGGWRYEELCEAEAHVLDRVGWRLRVRVLPYDAVWEELGAAAGSGVATVCMRALALASRSLVAVAPARVWAREIRRAANGELSRLMCVLLCEAKCKARLQVWPGFGQRPAVRVMS